MDSRLLEILVCPLCKGPLQLDREHHRLCCSADRLGFPIKDGIPIMLEDQAVALQAGDTLTTTFGNSLS